MDAANNTIDDEHAAVRMPKATMHPPIMLIFRGDHIDLKIPRKRPIINGGKSR